MRRQKAVEATRVGNVGIKTRKFGGGESDSAFDNGWLSRKCMEVGYTEWV